MLENIFSKVILGMISFSMLLLSSYKGNDATFSEINLNRLNSGIFIETELIDAFENDFEQIFKSGKKIDIIFDVKIIVPHQDIYHRIFLHSVTFHPMRQYYSVYLEEKKQELKIDDFSELKNIVSKFGFPYFGKLNSEMEIDISAFLPELKMDSSKKKFDLMLLWNFKIPKIKTKVKIENEI